MPDDPVVETRMIPSDPVQFKAIRDWISGVVLKVGFDDREALELTVAVNEACANIHRHAYAGREDGAIEFELEVEEARVHLKIRDYGRCFRPEACPGPDLEDPSEGGYGVFLIREFMDEVEYIRREAGTELRMMKSHNGERAEVKGEGLAGEN